MGTPRKIEYADLVGIPYAEGGATKRGCNCVGVGKLALDRMCAPLEPGDLPTDEVALWASVTELSEDPKSSPWVCIGMDARCATQLGDMILSQAEDGSHVGVLVDGPRRMVLTACAPLYRDEPDPEAEVEKGQERPTRRVLASEGRTFALPARRIRGCVGVYRLRRWEAAS